MKVAGSPLSHPHTHTLHLALTHSFSCGELKLSSVPVPSCLCEEPAGDRTVACSEEAGPASIQFLQPSRSLSLRLKEDKRVRRRERRGGIVMAVTDIAEDDLDERMREEAEDVFYEDGRIAKSQM